MSRVRTRDYETSLPSAKRPCLDHPSKPVAGIIQEKFTTTLHNLNFKPEENQEAEIEVRLGRVGDNNRFIPGVTKEFFESVLDTLKARSYPSVTFTHKDYCYEEPVNKRITLNENNEIIALKKIRKGVENIRFYPDVPYDFRISVSSEETLQPPQSIPTDWTTLRIKERTRYKYEHWRIDMTKVTQSTPNTDQPPNILYEIEFELHRSIGKKISAATIQLVNLSLDLLCSLWHKFERYVVHVTETSELRKLCWQIVTNSTNVNSFDKFPGSMPVSLSRRHFDTVKTNPYFISDKTDGIRFMLLILHGGKSYFIDRKFEFYRLSRYPVFPSGSFELSTFLAGEGHTLLDGEVIENVKTKKIVFMLFDALLLNGKNYVSQKFQYRLRACDDVIKIYQLKIVTHLNNLRENGIVHNTFELNTKKFFGKNQILADQNPESALFSKLWVDQNDNHIRYFYDKRTRFHKTDGFIITPDAPYHPLGTTNFFKWKYSDLQSIDFALQYNFRRQSLSFAVMGNNKELVTCRDADLLPEDQEIIEKILDKRNKNWRQNGNLRGIIVEMVYDTSVGMWRFHTERPDKQSPNHIKVAFDTMESLADGISLAEVLQLFSDDTISPHINFNKITL